MNGLRSCIFQVTDIVPVRDWYIKALNVKPYFENESYAGFDVGGYELGLFKREANYIKTGNNVEIYWGVDDLQTELHRLIELGAQTHNPVENVGGGISMASVIDPFGNIFGLIHNPNFSGQ